MLQGTGMLEVTMPQIHPFLQPICLQPPLHAQALAGGSADALGGGGKPSEGDEDMDDSDSDKSSKGFDASNEGGSKDPE